MQQRQPRLGDILDDYCPRERRLTNHAVVAMIGPDVKQTRCTTCDAEHDYKHARVPRQRRSPDSADALFSQVASGAPRRVPPQVATPTEQPAPLEGPAFEPAGPSADDPDDQEIGGQMADSSPSGAEDAGDADADGDHAGDASDGPIHRRLIRATLPRLEGQPPAAPRPAPEFTIRQPTGRVNRFRPRQPRGAQPFNGQGTRSDGNVGPMRSGGRQGAGRPPDAPRMANRHGSGRKRSR